MSPQQPPQQQIDTTEDRTITPETLARIYIAGVLDPTSGEWGSVSVAEATDAQFDTWARRHLNITDDNRVWTTQERVDVCSIIQLWHGPLARLTPATVDPSSSSPSSPSAASSAD